MPFYKLSDVSKVPSEGDAKPALPPAEQMVRDEHGTLAGFLARTVGRKAAIPGALLLSPTNPMKVLGHADRDKMQKVYEEMRAKHPEALRNTVVQVGGHDLMENFKRTWNNEDLLFGVRHLMALREVPLAGVMASLGRADHYTPASDTVTMYSPSPEILRHELGHAIDFNNKREALAKWLNSLEGSKAVPEWLKRQAASTGPALYQEARTLVPGANLWTEAQATRHALNSVEDDPERSARAWTMLAPAYGTYAGGAAAALHALALHKGWVKKPMFTNPILGFGAYALGGVAAGHGVAAIRNALARREREQVED